MITGSAAGATDLSRSRHTWRPSAGRALAGSIEASTDGEVALSRGVVVDEGVMAPADAVVVAGQLAWRRTTGRW